MDLKKVRKFEKVHKNEKVHNLEENVVIFF